MKPLRQGVVVQDPERATRRVRGADVTDQGDDDRISLDWTFWQLLRAASKVMVDRLGGTVEISYEELLAADEGVTSTIMFNGDKGTKPIPCDATWTITNRLKPPPDEPVRVNQKES